jgi:hypothetical protein
MAFRIVGANNLFRGNNLFGAPSIYRGGRGADEKVSSPCRRFLCVGQPHSPFPIII